MGTEYDIIVDVIFFVTKGVIHVLHTKERDYCRLDELRKKNIKTR